MFRMFGGRRPMSRSERGMELWCAIRRMRDGVRQLISPRPNPPRPNPPRPNPPSPQNNSPSPQNNPPSPQNNSPSPQNNSPSPSSNETEVTTISDVSDISDISEISDVSSLSNLSNSDSNQENDDSNQESEENENESNSDSNEENESNSDSSADSSVDSSESNSDSNESNSDSNDEEDDEDDEDGEDGENEAKLSDDEEDDEDGGDEDGGDGENGSDEDEANLPNEIQRTKSNGVTITLRRYKDLDIYISRDGKYRATNNGGLVQASNILNAGRYPAYNTGYTRYQINHMVASCWLSNPNNWHIINHKDGNRQNCDFRNLEWVRLQYHYNPMYGYTKHIINKNGKQYQYHRFRIENPQIMLSFKTRAQWNLCRRRAEPIMNQYNQDGNAIRFKNSLRQLERQIKSGH